MLFWSQEEFYLFDHFPSASVNLPIHLHKGKGLPGGAFKSFPPFSFCPCYFLIRKALPLAFAFLAAACESTFPLSLIYNSRSSSCTPFLNLFSLYLIICYIVLHFYLFQIYNIRIPKEIKTLLGQRIITENRYLVIAS